MNKIVDWGHWLVAAVLAVKGFALLYEIVAYLPQAWRHPNTLTYPTDHLALGLCALYFACAWGILTWRSWGRKVALAITAFESVIVAALMVVTYGLAIFNARMNLIALLNCAAMIWLVLPAVRAEYLRRNQIA